MPPRPSSRNSKFNPLVSKQIHAAGNSFWVMTLGCGRKLLSNPVWPMIFSGVYLMRAHISLPVVFTAFFLAGCAQVTNQISSTDAAAV
jgi:hypothetical protein